MTLRLRSAARVYELRRRVAVGGMGEVYEGFAPDLARLVAIKRVLKSDDSADLKDLFLREVAVAATLEHPNVVEVIDAGIVAGDLYLVMEFVDGPSLAEILEALRRHRKILPIEITCGLVAQIARGLAHAHERSLPDGTSLGILHRDVAPENVLLTKSGLPKLADFGLATLQGHDFTNPGTIRGRPRCLSPEQARGERIDVRSDVFALGAMMFELASGQPLYPNEPLATLLFKVAAGEYDPIRARIPMADPDLISILETAVAVEPRDRFRSARELERAVDSFRAARGMRVDSGSIAKLIATLSVEILRVRAERRDDGPGELEGQRVHLPAERFDTTAGPQRGRGQTYEAHLASSDLPQAFYEAPTTGATPESPVPVRPRTEDVGVLALPSRAIEDWGSNDIPGANPLAARGVPQPGYAASPLAQPLGGASQTWTGSADLPRPEAPAKHLVPGKTRGEVGWFVFLGLVLVAAALAFAGIWTRAEDTHGADARDADSRGLLVLPTQRE